MRLGEKMTLSKCSDESIERNICLKSIVYGVYQYCNSKTHPVRIHTIVNNFNIFKNCVVYGTLSSVSNNEILFIQTFYKGTQSLIFLANNLDHPHCWLLLHYNVGLQQIICKYVAALQNIQYSL